MSRITDTVRALAEPVAASHGLDVWDVEYIKEAGTWYLRVYIDKPEGISISDCETFSRAMDPILDEADPIEGSYTFEVSSAGAERSLKRPSDFERFIGSYVEVKLYKAKFELKTHLGNLKAYDGGAVVIESGGNEMRFEKTEVANVRLRIQ